MIIRLVFLFGQVCCLNRAYQMVDHESLKSILTDARDIDWLKRIQSRLFLHKKAHDLSKLIYELLLHCW